MTETSNALIDRIDVEVPCDVPWSSMDGDDRVRHCSDCKLNVYNLSDMTTLEAEELVAGRERRLCVTYLRRPDGTVVTKDCLSVVKAIKRRARWFAGAFAALFGLSTTATVWAAESTGGFDSWTTWQKQPFRTLSKILPDGWTPEPPSFPNRILGIMRVPPCAQPPVQAPTTSR